MATSFDSRSCISLPPPSFAESLKSAWSMTPRRSFASASLAMIVLIRSPISLSPLSFTMSAKPPPSGTSMIAPGRPAYWSETYFMKSRVRT